MRLFQIKKSDPLKLDIRIAKRVVLITLLLLIVLFAYRSGLNLSFDFSVLKMAWKNSDQFDLRSITRQLDNQASINEFSTQDGVNAFVFFNKKGTFVIDATGTPTEAMQLVELLRSKGSIPQQLLITHGRPDRYWGLATLKKAFPALKIVVATESIKNDIIRNLRSNDPVVLSKSDAYPNSFDYQKEIEILSSNRITLPSGLVLELTNYTLSDRSHITLVYARQLNSVFASDLVYNQVHLLCEDTNSKAFTQWKAVLKSLKEMYGSSKTTVYPGYGPATDSSVFEANYQYLEDLLAATKSSSSKIEAKDKMLRQYPAHINSSLSLDRSITGSMRH